MLGILIIIAIATSCAQAGHGRAARHDDLITVLENAGHYTKALAALNATNLLDRLMNETAVTLFLPTDDAYLNASTIAVMNMNIQFHIVSNESIKVANRVSDSVHNTMDLQPLRLNVYKILGIFAAEGVEITERNLQITNGYVHGLGGIMTPPAGNAVYLMSQRPELSTFFTLLNQTGLLDQVKNDHNITLFAPSEAAFQAMESATLNYLWSHQELLKEVLLYHIIDRQTLYSIGMRHHLTFPTADHDHDRVVMIEDGSDHIFVNEAKITEADISATNGVIHVVDKVLIPTKVIIEMEEQNLVVVG